jgi:hypothetical protein
VEPKPQRMARVEILTAKEKSGLDHTSADLASVWKQWIESRLYTMTTGDRMELPDAETFDHAAAVRERLQRFGVTLVGPDGRERKPTT